MRRIRPWVVAAGCLAALVVVAALVVRFQGDLLRESAANYLRERLAVEFGAQFETRDLRGRWFPPGLSLGHVTFQRPGETWVLTAEDVRVSFNLYAMLFRRERLGRVVLERPRLFVRAAGLAPRPPSPEAPPDARANAPAEAKPDAPRPASPATEPPVPAPGVPAIAARLRGLLRPPFPLRILEVVDGRVEVLDRAGRLTAAEGVNLAVIISSGSAGVDLSVAGLAVKEGERRLALGRITAALALEEGGATVSRFAATGGPLAGSVQGTVDYA
ncbi:MAG TPA: hypothetical protein VN317_06740, partial [Candidatus Methanoperedens sp.]|nr:hypothetical protein [Candidatus Methanoperedens sp.]